jgi:hypothetical protein
MYTPEELLQFTPKATFNFNNLLKKLFRLSVPRTLVMAGCQSKSKETPVADPQQILENKV